MNIIGELNKDYNSAHCILYVIAYWFDVIDEDKIVFRIREGIGL